MKKGILLLVLSSVLLFSCKKDEVPEFERGDIFINTQIDGRTGNQGGVEISMYDISSLGRQFLFSTTSNSAGVVDYRKVIAGTRNIVANWSETLTDGTIITYTADTLVEIIPDVRIELDLVLKQ